MTDASGEVFNHDEAISRCFGNHGLFAEMVAHFFDEADNLLRRMREVLERGDLVEVGQHAHRLKGTIVYLGAQPATEATQRVEQVAKAGDLRRTAAAVDALAQYLRQLKEALRPHYSGGEPA